MMRKYPHKIDEEIIGEHRASAEKLVAEFIPELPEDEANRNALGLKIAGKEIRDCGVYSYAFGEPDARVIERLRQANDCFTKAIGFGLIMDPYEYIEYLALAIILTDVNQAKHLAAFPRSRYLHPDVGSGEVIHLLAESLGLLLLGAKELPERLAAARRELASKGTTRYDRGIAESLIAMAEAIAARDQPAFDQAVAARQRDFKQAHNRPSERNMPEALLDMPGLALVRLALARGLRCQAPSAYLPVELLQR